MTVFTDTWTGSNGAAWPSPWVTSTGSAGGTATIQGNQGQMVSPTIAYDATRAFYGVATATDVDITVTAVWQPAEQYYVISWRHNGSWQGTGGDPATGYQAVFNPQTPYLELLSNVAGVQTSLAVHTAFTLTGTTPVKLRVQSIGAAHKVKVWDSDLAEPAGWAIEVTNSAVTAAGRAALSFGAGAASSVAAWDDWSYNDAAAAVFAPGEFVQLLGTAVSTAATGPPNTLTVTFTGTVKPAVGDLVVVYCARDNIINDPATGDTISTSPGGNTFTRVALAQPAVTSTANAGIVGAAFYAVLTAAWPSGTNTLTWTMPTGTADRVMRAEHYKGPVTGLRGTADTAGGTTTNAASVLTTDPVTGDLVLAMGCWEQSNAGSTITGDSDTTLGSWTAIGTLLESGGATTAAVKLGVQRKTVTGTGNQTWTASSSITADAVAIVLVFQPSVVVATRRRQPVRAGGARLNSNFY